MNKILGLAMIFLCCPFLGRSFADKIVLSRAEVNYNIYQTLDTLGLEGFSFKDEIAECIAEFDRQKFEEYKNIVVTKLDKREFEGFSSKEDLLNYYKYFKSNYRTDSELLIYKYILKSSAKFGKDKYLSFLESIETSESLPPLRGKLTRKEREELKKEKEEKKELQKREENERHLEEILTEFNVI